MGTTRKLLIVIAILVLSLGAGAAWADILELRDGTIIKGTYVGGSQNNIKFEANGEIEVYSRSEVLTLTMTGGSGNASAAAGATAAAQAAAPPAEAAPAASGGITVPAGTSVMVRTIDPIDSKKHKTGYRFTSALEADLVSGGTVVAAKGSMVYGILTEAKQSRRMTGKTELTVVFNQIMIGSQMHPIVSGQLKAVSGSTGKKTAGRAVRGAAIGGLISGSSGAKTGAKVGVGVSLLTKGDQVNIPKGTLVEFTLAEALTL